ncbi:MAG TPA: SWIM zinc finger domain-containing protein, partial [Ilumatobacteraceae bacterium]|nr:SWIM zinc finger domain-containing protein [Ilumatobacteraceae bacterium]
RAEPYDVVIDHTRPAYFCSCPSRAVPCKHAIALLLLWVRGHVPAAQLPPSIAALAVRLPKDVAPPSAAVPPITESDRTVPGQGGQLTISPDLAGTPPNSGRDERVARMHAGLRDLLRWLDDRARFGLSDPSLARYATWDDLAARLVDAQVGGLANRVRRLAGLVGVGHDWHRRVAEELGMLWVLANGGLNLSTLPTDLADSVAMALGWQVRTATVLDGAPETDRWLVAGRSDTREDRIEVRRVWLYGLATRRWAMVLSFAAYRQSLDGSLAVGSVLHADLFRYPGRIGLRAIVGLHHGPSDYPSIAPALSVVDGCAAVGSLIAAEPWLEHVPVTVLAAVTRSSNGWVLSDEFGSIPLVGQADALQLVAATGGQPAALTVEWTPHGVIPLTVHLPDRAIDIGPRADPSFAAA